MARALYAATAEWWGNSLMKLRARVRSGKETKNSSQWLPEPKNMIRQWSRTLKCDPKKCSTELKNTKIEKLFWIALWRSTPLANRILWLGKPLRSVLSFLNGPHPRPKFH